MWYKTYRVFFFKRFLNISIKLESFWHSYFTHLLIVIFRIRNTYLWHLLILNWHLFHTYLTLTMYPEHLIAQLPNQSRFPKSLKTPKRTLLVFVCGHYSNQEHVHKDWPEVDNNINVMNKNKKEPFKNAAAPKSLGTRSETPLRKRYLNTVEGTMTYKSLLAISLLFIDLNIFSVYFYMYIYI